MTDAAAPPPKWRPALWMIVFAAVVSVAVAPVVALYAIVFVEWFFAVDFRFHTIWDAGLVLVVTVLFALVLAFVASRVLLRPVLRMIERTGEIERGEAGAFQPLPHYGTREMALLAERFTRLARRLSERNEDLVLFSRHLTHELKSPLTSIRGAVELMEDAPDMGAKDRVRFLANVAADAERLDRLANALRELASAELRAGEGSVSAAEAAALACDHVEGLKASVEGDADLPVSAENAAIVFAQLAGNARENGASLLRVKARDGLVLVGDDGAAIPEGNHDRVLEPFFTTRREGGGTGLGLSIAAAVLQRHGANLATVDDPAAIADGWKFAISWPAGRERPR